MNTLTIDYPMRSHHPPALHRALLVSALSIILVAVGCQAPTKTSPTKTTDTTDATDATNAPLSNGYSLLHELLGKQKNVDKVLWLKSAPKELDTLIKQAATVSSQGEESIAEFAKDDPTIQLDQQNLPPIEQASRDAIESSTTRRLLTASGRDFHMLLTHKQIQATEYGLHLAQVLAQKETNEARKDWLRGFEESYTRLRDDFTDWLMGNTTGTAKEVESNGS